MRGKKENLRLVVIIAQCNMTYLSSIFRVATGSEKSGNSGKVLEFALVLKLFWKICFLLVVLELFLKFIFLANVHF